MTPAEEIENIIQETVMHGFHGVSETYPMTTFPETHLMIVSACYTLRIKKEFYRNDEVAKRYEEVRNLVNNRKITVKNKILDMGRPLSMGAVSISMGAVSMGAVTPIYYKDCVFTQSNFLLGQHFENCIVEGI